MLTLLCRYAFVEQASIKTFRFSDLLSATMRTSLTKKKRRNRSLYALSVLFLLAYLTVSTARTSHAHVRERDGDREGVINVYLDFN